MRPLPANNEDFQLGANDRLLDMRQYDWRPIRGSEGFSHGRWAAFLARPGQRAGTAQAAPGTVLVCPVQFDRPNLLSHVGLDIDPAFWDPRLDLVLQLQLSNDVVFDLGRFPAAEVPRRWGEGPLLRLADAFPLPANRPLVFRLLAVPAPGVSAQEAQHARIAVPVFRSESVPFPEPVAGLHLLGAPAQSGRFVHLDGQEEMARTWIINSPWEIYQTYGAGTAGRSWLPSSNRPMTYVFRFDMYGPPAYE